MKTFLTIAGSDPSGGAGIQADIKTAAAFGFYSMSVITAVTVQNTRGVSGVVPLSPELIKAQAEAVFEDIFPDCVKIGMCAGVEGVDAIADTLERYRPKNTVIDTILLSSSGYTLLERAAAEHMCERLFPLADIITPNVPEAAALTGMRIESEADMERAAEHMHKSWGCAVLLKGGHLNGSDLFYDGSARYYRHELIDNPNTHGTGCTLSSALACSLARGMSMADAAGAAVGYVTGAIGSGLDLGSGCGPLDHMWYTDCFYDK